MPFYGGSEDISKVTTVSSPRRGRRSGFSPITFNEGSK